MATKYLSESQKRALLSIVANELIKAKDGSERNLDTAEAILKYRAKGMTCKAIDEKLGIPETTVHSYRDDVAISRSAFESIYSGVKALIKENAELKKTLCKK